jgi:hypothetical protein
MAAASSRSTNWAADTGHGELVDNLSLTDPTGSQYPVMTDEYGPFVLKNGIKVRNLQNLQTAAVPGQPAAPPAAGGTMKRSGFMGLVGKKQDYSDPTKAAMLEQQRQIETAALVSGLGQAAQLGATFVPTAQDAYNRRRMGEIETRQSQIQRELENRDFGLSAEERQLLENTAMAPVQAMARESRLNEEAALASMGGTSAAAQVRARREERRNVADQARAAALGIEAQDIRLAQEQMAELKREDTALREEGEERVAYKSERAKGRLEAGVATVGALGNIMGTTMAGKGQKTIDPRTLTSIYGLSEQHGKLLEENGNLEPDALIKLAEALAAREKSAT